MRFVTNILRKQMKAVEKKESKQSQVRKPFAAHLVFLFPR